VIEELERLKWLLWHGNVFLTMQTIDDLAVDLDAKEASPEQRKLLKVVTEFGGCIRANASSSPNYGEHYRAGEPISSAFVESTVNQVVSKRMVKKQQNALDTQERASAAAGAGQGAQRGAGWRLPAVVPRVRRPDRVT